MGYLLEGKADTVEAALVGGPLLLGFPKNLPRMLFRIKD